MYNGSEAPAPSRCDASRTTLPLAARRPHERATTTPPTRHHGHVVYESSQFRAISRAPAVGKIDEDYAIRIARDWNVKHDGAGFVTRFEVDSEFLSRYPVRQAGGKTILELWVPAQELDAFNAHIVGPIRLVHAFR
ncbi:hypothetical protein [Streptomyces sp. NPDC001978]|uniref:hypothetical protein n=1 Tax=Streptomyces sp. NPDC001978 TaxID=3364627 RepID=UPI003690C9F7